jgi:cytochrome c5
MRKFAGLGLAVALAALVGNYAIASQRMDDGRRAYEEACSRCHDTGVDGAPVVVESGDWSGRSGLWEAVLFEHVKKGYMTMPAKGGKPGLSEYDAEAAAEYLLNKSHPELQPDSDD